MTEVLFYHLTESKLEDALPPLLEKCLERDWRVVVQVPDEARRDRLDDHLWSFRDDSFLPHGTDAAPHADEQPVLITIGPENANAATVRFLVDGMVTPALDTYQRAVFLFDGFQTEQVEHARTEWKRLKAEGHQLTYWQQDRDGRWAKKG
ncbi:DNA polymerase III, chi subunit [Rhizobium sp. RU20A]|uniref:DNA polymerase III subunit chi n=1 Tax=Rhizobium sp. RU20A TaxID=1907412 RepID=UPI000956F4EC|nr:DNA polymerase III subunit chi [Rhizobium sp. RU20A]SIP93848.1 DNA polymerase III, chi subunit [Rhizobium sp. RU20A]